MRPELTIVVPCYNEREALPHTIEVLTQKLAQLVGEDKIGDASKILFVDDGSKDETWRIIAEYAATHPAVSGVKLSRNCGHQNALLAGLQHVKSDICISIDADLQDDVNAIDEMVDLYHQGFQIVYGVRAERNSDTFFKRTTAHLFYRSMSWLGVESVEHHADFRLMSRDALAALLSFSEVNAYIRGLVPLVGYKTACVQYRRVERVAGESKYTLSKMLSLAVRGITSFSVVPLRVISVTGLLISLLAALLAVWVIFAKLLGNTSPGWASTTLSIVFIGGVQLLALGVVGEYVGCIYLEVKRRPRYFVEQTTLN
ncbi:glycosyltransferase family 2 protein [Paraburkholderia lycopersici]|uniref:Glycosyltransferase involved in cell wall bisynthesis n=1 Tax=Paraburkholderia lycopersici TaxID=416944 RepID=A0A1G6NHE1_9BURK|nr:glycosyltransferase family 2 protein [Paraburkholderia lycopersici]SDC66677.1 Glycosyltransferase involved in cell wall bisynthesis [Paraburkholderia lycopersici]